MVDLKSDIPGEEIYRIPLGQGLYTSELPSNIPDGFCPVAHNLVATGDSLENRIGLRQTSVDHHKLVPTKARGYDFNIRELHIKGAALAWGATDDTTHTLCLIKDKGVSGGDAFIEVTAPARVTGIAGYADRIFVSTEGGLGLYEITAINWATDSVTFANLTTFSAFSTIGYEVISFKDRLWVIAGAGDQLYYSNLPAAGSTSQNSFATTQFVRFPSTNGFARIFRVIPLGNKLIVFTESGVHWLLVEGDPGSWIRKVLDGSSQTTFNESAFESKGVVYFINTNGIFATNGQQVAKLSGTIEDQFFLSKGTILHGLFYYEDGMLAFVSHIFEDNRYDSENCRIFYSKLDPVAWTSWNIDNGDGTTNTFGDNRITCLHGVSLRIPTALNSDPLSYVLAGVTDNKTGLTNGTRHQLLVFDGGENQMRDRAGTLQTQAVSCVLKTKYFDAGNAYRNKMNKQAFLEMYTSDTLHKFTTSWDIDATTGVGTVVRETATQDFTVGQTSNLIRIPSGFPFRRCALTLKSTLQSNTSQIKIKDMAIALDTEAFVTERVQ